MTSGVADFGQRLQLLLSLLGFTGDPDFLTDPDGLGPIQVSHAVRAAFERMGVVGVFCPQSSLGAGSDRRVPVLYVAAARSEDADAIHRSIWSQSVVPMLLIATELGFEIRNGFDYRKHTAWPWTELDGEGLPASLLSLTAQAMRSSASWRDFHVPTRVDERLGKSVSALSDEVVRRQPRLADRRDIVNALVGRFLYLYVLIDRGVIDQAWVDDIHVNGRPACRAIRIDEGFAEGQPPPRVWPTTQVWRLFDAIDDQLNGSIFPLTREERALAGPETLQFIRRVLRADDIRDGKQQYGFLDVDYATIRTETISALYECFFELEDGDAKKRDGAFYTPPFLVDYIVDEIDGIDPIDATSLVVDPACGSGAFLVASFRRIVEKQRRLGLVPTAPQLHEILSRCVAGFEVKRQAANVARFSLYLTLLDYLPGLTLREIPSAMAGKKLFPPLVRRVHHGDAFGPIPADIRRKATHVLANPPWTPVPKGSRAEGYRQSLAIGRDAKLLSPKDGMAETFYWRALHDLCAPHGHVAMVLPTKSFISPSATVFPDALAGGSRVLGITNLAHFRERLFANAREAATVVFASPAKPASLDWTWRYSPKPSSQPVGKDGVPWAIVVDRCQVERFRQADMLLPEHEWFRDLMLQPLDRQFAATLSRPRGGSARSLGEFIDRAGILVRRGGSPAETGLSAEKLLNTKSNDYRVRLGRLPGTMRDYELTQADLDRVSPSFRTAFQGPMLLMSRAQSGTELVDHAAAYASSLLGIFVQDGNLSRTEQLTVLEQIGAYPATSVGRYLLALFGRLWVFDQRRFEAKDLRRLPFPYPDTETLLARPVTSFSDKDFTAFCRESFGTTDLFVTAVNEHHNLRERYQDGRRPTEGSTPTEESERKTYAKIFVDELSAVLDEPVAVVFGSAAAEGSLGFSASIGAAPISAATSWRPTRLSEELSLYVESTRGGATIQISKPDVRSAWTAERAYADALAALRGIMAA